MTAPKYGPWQAHNATPDSTCPPDAVGKAGRVISANGEHETPDMSGLRLWASDTGIPPIVAWQALIEPVRGEVVKHVAVKGGFVTHTLRLPTLDGALIPGEYIGPDGATIVVGVV